MGLETGSVRVDIYYYHDNPPDPKIREAMIKRGVPFAFFDVSRDAMAFTRLQTMQDVDGDKRTPRIYVSREVPSDDESALPQRKLVTTMFAPSLSLFEGILRIWNVVEE